MTATLDVLTGQVFLLLAREFVGQRDLVLTRRHHSRARACRWPSRMQKGYPFAQSGMLPYRNEPIQRENASLQKCRAVGTPSDSFIARQSRNDY